MFSIPFEVERSISAAKPPAEVFEIIGSFAEWPRWSPWLCIEPDCEYSVTGDAGCVGHRQEWSGKLIGAGSMEIVRAVGKEEIDYDLQFLKPWKSRASVRFRVRPKGGGTAVVWRMESSLPLFLFFMKKRMTTWLGGDFERGLAMLKEFAENGSVLSEVQVGPVETRHEMYYLGKRRACGLGETEAAMKNDLAAMKVLLEENRLPVPESVFTLYHRFDPVKQAAEYTTGFVYSDPPPAVREDVVSGRLPDHRALRVNHKGAYRHLGNAWAAVTSCARAGHKVDKSVPMYEVYTSDPRDVPEREIQTDIFLPVRAQPSAAD